MSKAFYVPPAVKKAFKVLEKELKAEEKKVARKSESLEIGNRKTAF